MVGARQVVVGRLASEHQDPSALDAVPQEDGRRGDRCHAQAGRQTGRRQQAGAAVAGHRYLTDGANAVHQPIADRVCRACAEAFRGRTPVLQEVNQQVDGEQEDGR